MDGRMFGDYRLDALLGRGGMGEVHRAFDMRRNRTVALKVLLAPFAADEEFRARFRAESRLAAGLDSPYTVPIHDFGEIDGRLFIDMRYVDGRDLAAVLTAGPLLPRRAVEIIAQVAAALDVAHAARLVHRDVKPSNVRIAARPGAAVEHCYLLDFGIARSIDAGGTLTHTGGIIGTLAYMAPERFLGTPAGPYSDIYSLACLLHECLAGQRPFAQAEPLALPFAHQNWPRPRPSALRPDLPPGLDAVVERGMAVDPAHRFATARELAAAARAALPAPIVVLTDPRPQVPPAVPGRLLRRRTLLIGGGIVGAAAAGAIFAATRERRVADPIVPAVAPSSGASVPKVQLTGSATFDRMIARGRAVVGCKNDQPGLGLAAPNGTPEGFDIEIARLLAAGLGFGVDRIDFRPIPSAVREETIGSGEIDFFVGTYTITSGRKLRVSFAGPYLTGGQGLLVRRAETVITGPGTLRGKRVCAVADSTPLEHLNDLKLTEPKNIVELPTSSACVELLIQGNAEAVTTDDAILKGYAAAQPEALKLVGAPFSEVVYGVGLAHDDVVLRTKLNDLLQAAFDDGSWQRIYAATLGRSGAPGAPPALQRY
jgi:glutamate transport system substrate-binding protein